MAVTKEDLRDFNRFADEKVENGGANSLVELVSEWEAQRRETTQSHIEIDARTLSVLAAAFPDVDDPERLKQACARRGGSTTAQLLSKAALAAEKASQE